MDNLHTSVVTENEVEDRLQKLYRLKRENLNLWREACDTVNIELQKELYLTSKEINIMIDTYEYKLRNYGTIK